MEKLISLLIFLFSSHVLLAQTVGEVKVVEDNRIRELAKKHEQINREKETISGYRVQIHYGSDREKAMEQKVKFLQQYPNMETYETYQAPNFKIRVGDYRTRIEAQKFAKEISILFPAAFIVSDDIKLPKVE